MVASTPSHAGNDSGFLSWWTRELAELLPERLAGRARPRDVVIAHDDGSRIALTRLFRGAVDELGVIEHGDEPALEGGRRHLDTTRDLLVKKVRDLELPVVLRLSSDQGLLTSDELPKGALAELRPIIANKLDLLTPWADEQACFSVSPQATLPGERVEVEIAVVPRAMVEAALDRLERLGLAAEIVDLAGEDPLAPPGPDLLGRRPRQAVPRLVWGLLALAVLAVVGTTSFAAYDLSARGGLIDERRAFEAALEQRLEDLPGLRARINELKQQANTVIDHRMGRPSALITIEALSRALPDSVWLDTVALEGQSLLVAGFAEDATRQLALLERTRHFTDARFEAANTRMVTEVGDQERRVDRFSLSARVLPEWEVLP